MITCRDLAELLLDFVADQLSREHRGHVELHLRSCSCCAAYVESYRLTIQLTRQLPRSPLPGQLEQRLRAILEGDCKTQGVRQREESRQIESNY